jgi:hypothetical protein
MPCNVFGRYLSPPSSGLKRKPPRHQHEAGSKLVTASAPLSHQVWNHRPVINPGTGFPIRRLLRLAGLQWRYSTAPPHRHSHWTVAPVVFEITPRHGPRRKHSPSTAVESFTAPLYRKDRGAKNIKNTVLLLSRALPSNGRCLPGHCLATGLYATIFSGQNVSQARNQQKQVASWGPSHPCLFFSLLDLEDEGVLFLRNTRIFSYIHGLTTQKTIHFISLHVASNW